MSGCLDALRVDQLQPVAQGHHAALDLRAVLLMLRVDPVVEDTQALGCVVEDHVRLCQSLLQAALGSWAGARAVPTFA